MSPQSSVPTRILILGGSSEATALARALADRRDVNATLSLAGRTTQPPLLPVPARIGGFGGADGLAAYLEDERIDVLVDATHPFAARIARAASEAAARAGCTHIKVSRPAWAPEPGDQWIEVADMAAAADALGAASRRVFLAIGSLQLDAFATAPQHNYLVRTIDPVVSHKLPQAAFITARGPFDPDAEERLMRDHAIEFVVTKNSGGTAAAAKLIAARRLAIPVVIVARPDVPASTQTVAQALVEIEAHVAARRGV